MGERDGGIRGQAQHPAVLRVRRKGRNDDDVGKRGNPDGRLRQLLWRGQDRLHHLQRHGDRAEIPGQKGVRGRRLSGAPWLVALDGRVAGGARDWSERASIEEEDEMEWSTSGSLWR